jgi:hypothetical protein
MPADATQMLGALVAALESGYVELRPIHREHGPSRSEFFPVADFANAAERAMELGRSRDLYYGVIPRAHEGGRGAADVGPATTVWADLDSPEAMIEVLSFVAPSIMVATGTEGHHHAYWLLDAPRDAEAVVALNRDLALHLGADVAATDAARILRLPGTLNHKTDPPATVRLVALEDRRYSFAELRAAVPPPKPERRQTRATETRSSGKALRRVLDRLDGVRPTTNGWTALCPAHDDHNPSLSVSAGDDSRVLVRCHAGCATEAVLAALDLTMPDLFEDSAHQDSLPARLVRLVEQSDVRLFHDDLDLSYASIPVGGHREIHPVRSRKFKRWLRRELRTRTGAVVNAQAIEEAVETLCAEAEFDGEQRDVYVRIAPDSGGVLLDLGDERWRVVRTTADGWQILDSSPVAFARRSSAKALPDPTRGGSLGELRAFVNVADDASWRLLIGFLVMALQHRGPFPVLILLGEQGTAKTTLARVVPRLVDPAKAPLRAGQPSERDLMIAASGSWMPGFDNLSFLSPKLSDALCQISTGAGFATRKLYEDAEEVVFEAMRPLLLNGIGGFVKRPDLLGRAMVLDLPQLPESERRTEQEFWDTFEQTVPRILGALLDTLAGALARRDQVKLPALPRMADFAVLGTAVEQTLGWPTGSFIQALDANQSAALVASLDDEPAFTPLRGLVQSEIVWEGTATELLARLETLVDEQTKRRKSWPPNASQLSIRLRRMAPAMRKVGIEFEDAPTGRNNEKQRGIRLTYVDGDDGDSGNANSEREHS